MERKRRLREEWEVNETRRRGRAFADGPLVIRVAASTAGHPHNRYAVIAGKRMGNAVERNRGKRLVREALRAIDPDLSQGYDIAVIIRGGVQELSGLAVASETLERLFRRADLLRSRTSVSGTLPNGRLT